MKTVFSLLTVFSLCLVAIVSAKQDENFVISADTAPAVETPTTETVDDAIRVSLSEDGVLTGMVFKRVDDRQQPVAAKVTISKLNGETLSSEITEQDGSFEFNSIEPGHYTIVGVGPGYYGDEKIDVTSFGEAYTAQIPVEVSPGGFDAGVAYAGFQDAPISTFSGGGAAAINSGGCSMGSCGGGCSGGGGYGGSGGGGLRRLLPLVGLVGLVGLADDDDASPDM